MASPSNVRVGVVLPHSFYGEAEWQNAERAIAYADEAAGKGAQLLLYPEGKSIFLVAPGHIHLRSLSPNEEQSPEGRDFGQHVQLPNIQTF